MSLPEYLAKAKPNPLSNRAPWYKNTAPTYAGIFLWVVFYMKLSENTLEYAGVRFNLAAICVAAALSFLLYYLVPALLGMKTGYPLYVVGASTFGTRGGYLMPGLLMGLLQIGWFSVGTFVATNFILSGLGKTDGPGSAVFAIIAVAWGYTMAYIGVKGLQYVSRVSTVLNFIPAVMLILVLVNTWEGVELFVPPKHDMYRAGTTMIAAIIGFFATAGAAGADFGMNSRHEGDVRWGGIVGITLAGIFAAGVPLMSVAGAHGLDTTLASFSYDAVIAKQGGFLAPAMFFLFTLASIPAATVCAFIAGNSFSTMIPRVSRMGSTMAGCTIAIALAITGVAADLIGFFSIVGASFGPICGAIAADYILSGFRWAGPREGINWAGYLSWALGFVVGILPFLPLPADVLRWTQPAVVYSFIIGFVVYAILAKLGLQPNTVAMPAAGGAD